MNLQVIKSSDGRPEYVLLPIAIYVHLRSQIEKELKETQDEYVPFDLTDYIDNPIALARIKAHITQKKLADLLGVTQAYISKIENRSSVPPKFLNKVHTALNKFRE